MHESDVFDFMDRCNSFASPGPLLDELLGIAKQFGFNHLILSGVPIGGQKLAPMVELNGWPGGWFDRYVEQEYAAIDGVCRFSAEATKPFYWKDVPKPLADTEGSIRVANEATEFGICSGFAVPFLSFNHWQSVVSFASPSRDCSLPGRETAQLVSVATFAGAAVEALVCPQPELGPRLSEREKEILLWAAGGKTSSEVGEILGIAERTAKKHAANAREKLGVATTIQAVVEAIRRRIIHP